ncbi:MAG: tetratricopeptide repeat protein [Myxococcales bacterium]
MRSADRRALVWLAAFSWSACVHYTATSSAAPPPPASPAVAVAVAPPPPPPPASSAYSGYGDAVTQLRQRCDGGELGGCVGLGVLYQNGSLVPVDRDKARQLFQKACDGGDYGGCSALQGLTGAPAAAPSPTASPSVVVQSSPGLNYAVTTTYVDGKLVSHSVDNNLLSPEAVDEAKRLLAGLSGLAQKECDAGNQRGCVVLADRYLETDRPKAKALLKRACDAGEKSGCSSLTFLTQAEAAGGTSPLMISPGTSSPNVIVLQAPGTASGSTLGMASTIMGAVVTNLQTGCSAGNQQECIGLGMLYWLGRYVTKDRDKARQLLQGACKAGDTYGCTLLQTLSASK